MIILADDLGFSDLGCYGGEIRTPHLDGLAAGGLRFTQFYNTARCWPSRAALLTGYYAQQVRRDTVPGVTSGGQGTRPKWAKLLPEMLRPLGYRSYHSGKWHVDGMPLANGFRSLLLPGGRRPLLPPARPSSRTIESCRRSSRGPDTTRRPPSPTMASNTSGTCGEACSQPFFLYLAFNAPHFPLQAPPEDIARYRGRYRDGLGSRPRGALEADPGAGPGRPAASRTWSARSGRPTTSRTPSKTLGPGEVNRPVPWAR